MTEKKPEANDGTAKAFIPTDKENSIIGERYAKLPKYPAPPERGNTIVLLPLHDGRIHYACAKGLMEIIPLISGILDHPFSSLITLSRNKLVNGFLRLPAKIEWAVMIDSDIEFTMSDLRYLLANTTKEIYLASTAPYARKDDSGKVIERGLGFSCVHRSVLELIRSEIAVPFQHEGQSMADFFITGATSSGGFLGEDAGFWWACSQVGVIPRVEQRCNLVHWGVKAYSMPPPNLEI